MAAPAVEVVPQQQHPKNDPGQQSEQHFVGKLPGMAENLLGKEETGGDCHRQNQEAHPNHPEQQGFHRHQRRQTLQHFGHSGVVQALLDQCDQAGMQCGDGKQAVSQQSHQYVGVEQTGRGLRHHARAGEHRRQRRSGGGKRQHQGQQTGNRVKPARQPVNQYGQPQDQRNRIGQTKVECAPDEQRVIQQPAMQQQGHDHG